MREPLPPSLHGVPFRVAEGLEEGLSRRRMTAPDLERRMHGLRYPANTPHNLIEACTALLIVKRRPYVFSHTTAAALWGMPLPWRLADDPVLHVTAIEGRATITRAGVLAWDSTASHETRFWSHLPLLAPADTWASLAMMTDARGGFISREWTVAIGDFLVSGMRGRGVRAPALCTMAELRAAVERHGSRRGAAKLAWAIDRIRQPVDSPQETMLRLGLVAARLPEPAVQPAIMTAAGVRHPDLGYVDERLLLEYLGDQHRTDPRRWRDDLTRVQLFEDAGYRTMLVGADDVTPKNIGALAARVRRALRSAQR